MAGCGSASDLDDGVVCMAGCSSDRSIRSEEDDSLQKKGRESEIRILGFFTHINRVGCPHAATCCCGFIEAVTKVHTPTGALSLDMQVYVCYAATYVFSASMKYARSKRTCVRAFGAEYSVGDVI